MKKFMLPILPESSGWLDICRVRMELITCYFMSGLFTTS